MPYSSVVLKTIYEPRAAMSLSYRYGLDIEPRRGCVAGWQMLSEISRSDRLPDRTHLRLSPIPSKTGNQETTAMDHGQTPPAAANGRRRVSAVVALTLLEVIQTHDRPSEVFEEEDTSITMPRRLGLSDVVERQIRNYQDEVKLGRKISDHEFSNLVGLVIKRPDSEEVFFECGKRLANRSTDRRSRFMPRGLAVALARRRVRRRLKALFGRRIGGFAGGGFTMEGRALLFMQADPGGDACRLVSGLCSAVLGATIHGAPVVDHLACEARGDAFCRWGIQGGVEQVPPR